MPLTAKLRHRLRSLPARPGVYVFRDLNMRVLYVGKAISLRQRVRSYFQKNNGLEPAKRLMVKKIADLEYILVDSEIEALLLEATLIKKYRPPYNVIFRDDKFYQYIRITLKDQYPRVETTRRIAKDGSRYFGPYTSGFAVRQTLQILKRIFPYRACKEPPPKLCFDARLGRCLGHDFGPGSEERYRSVVKNLMRFLEGHAEEIIRGFRRQMNAAAKEHQFERAAQLRDRVQALEHTISDQKIISVRLEDEDIIGTARSGDLTAVNLFQIRHGKLLNRLNVMLQQTGDKKDEEILSSFHSQYYSQSTDHPAIVVTRSLPPDHEQLRRALLIKFEAPSRGKKRKLVQLAETNAADYLQHRQREWLNEEARAKLGIQELQHALHLSAPPQRIECYDISNVQGTNAVGSMIVFESGLKKNSDYRKFQIKTVTGSNDYAMLQEVLRRRFGHHRNASPPGLALHHTVRGRGGVARVAEGDFTRRGGGWPDPDLIIIDGGKGQLNAALIILRELGVSVPTIGLAKREEEIFVPGEKDSVRLPKDSEGLFLIQRIRDQAHRFAVGYYRKKHGAETTRSLLDEVPGIGPSTKRQLLQKFGTVQGIREAGDKELEQLVGQKKTKLLREHL